jgi:beta-lactamase regulating signal transducer with metallopeptidase domain
MNSTIFTGAAPLLLFVAKATIVLVAAVVATLFLRRGTAGERHLVWLAALVGVLALPLLQRIPSLQIGILPSRFAAAAEATTDAATDVIVVPAIASDAAAPRAVDVADEALESVQLAAPVTIAGVAGGAVTVISAAPATAAAPAAAAAIAGEPSIADSVLPASLLRTLAAVWAAVALSLLAWLAFGALQVRRIVRSAVDLTSPDWTTPLCEVADRLDLEQPPRLVASDRIEMAFACRALAPTVVLPVTATEWSDDRRRAVLFHELAHVKRHDLASHLLGRIACALYWFHPLVWTASRNLRNESEKACDDLVLSCGARPSEYAQHLLDMVTSVRDHGAPALGIPMARKKEFEGRMLAILDPAIRRASPGRVKAAAVIAGVGLLSLSTAAVAPARAVHDTPTRSASPRAVAPSANTAIVVAPEAPRTPQAPATAERARVSTWRTRPAPVVTRVSADTDGTFAEAIGEAASDAVFHDLGRDLGREFADATTNAVVGVFKGVLGQRPVEKGDTARIALLIKVLQTDTDAQVRRSAAWGLNEAATTAARAALARALASDADADVREMAAWALGESPGEEGRKALASAVRSDRSAKVRATAAWAIGQDGRRGDADALIAVVSDADESVRGMALWALGQLDLRSAPPAVVAALKDGSPRVRETAAWALGQIGDAGAATGLVSAFEAETDAKAKRTDLWALSQLGEVPTAAVEAAMKSNDPQLRRRAVAMLAGDGASWPMPRPMPRPRPGP